MKPEISSRANSGVFRCFIGPGGADEYVKRDRKAAAVERFVLSFRGSRVGDKCTLNSSCPDCYCERNSLASRDYATALFLPG